MLMFSTVSCLHAQNDNWKKHVGSLTADQMQDFDNKFIKTLPYNLSKKGMSEKDCLKNFMLFRKSTKAAPFGSYYLYNGDFTESKDWLKGKSVYETMLDSISDPAMRAVFINSILSLGHNFIDNLDSINVIRDEVVKKQDENDTISVPLGMIKYAHLYYKYAGNPTYYPANLYDKEKARENFASAFIKRAEINFFFIVSPKERSGFRFFKKSFFDKGIKIYKIMVARKGGAGLIGRISVTGGT